MTMVTFIGGMALNDRSSGTFLRPGRSPQIARIGF